jgi:hypothetical protein
MRGKQENHSWVSMSADIRMSHLTIYDNPSIVTSSFGARARLLLKRDGICMITVSAAA